MIHQPKCFRHLESFAFQNSLMEWNVLSLKLTACPWKLMVGRWSLPFGVRHLFRCELLVSGRVSVIIRLCLAIRGRLTYSPTLHQPINGETLDHLKSTKKNKKKPLVRQGKIKTTTAKVCHGCVPFRKHSKTYLLQGLCKDIYRYLRYLKLSDAVFITWETTKNHGWIQIGSTTFQQKLFKF